MEKVLSMLENVSANICYPAGHRVVCGFKFHGVLDRKWFVRHFLSGIYFAQYHGLNIVVGLF
jgi:hypothetical protein